MNQRLTNARRMRHAPTPSELKIWTLLKNRQLSNHKFRRQAPLDHYIVDFICYEAKLIIEIDGGQHADEDPTRQKYLEAQGYTALRFWNNDVMENIEGVYTTITGVLGDN